MKDIHKLSLIVVVAIITRVFTIWIGTPEFAGWLNHVYYYFVQVRGLLTEGALPYPDMPLLFYLYAFVANIISGLGLAQDSAIVTSTRLVMSVVPALIPIPIYGIIKNIQGQQPLDRNQWIIVFLTGFLPLSVSYMPEYLQKNIFGILLLAILIYYSQRLFGKPNVRDYVITALLVVLIVLSHYGTFGAMFFYGLAVFIAYSIVKRDTKELLLLGLGLGIAGIISVALIYFLDVQRFARIFNYINESISNSLLVALFSGSRSLAQIVSEFGFIVILFSIFFLFHWLYIQSKLSVPIGDRLFWLANIMFCYLLVLPIIDQQLMSRLSSFATIPLIIIFAYSEKYSLKKSWLKTGSVAIVAFMVVFLAFGELVSSRIHSRNNEAILADIEMMQATHEFGSNDLVITRTGADHICNWFLGVKAGVITSVSLEDFERYDKIYVLNPLDGRGTHRNVEVGKVESEADKYIYMFRNIPKPEGVEFVFETQHLELFELEMPPSNWSFDADGDWNGYNKETS